MILGIVRGSIFSTIQHAFYRNRKLLIVDYIDPAGKPTGKYVIAIDSVGAGVGETVLVNDEGNGARQVLNDPMGPARSVIVAIVDAVEVAAD
ncbi:MAG: EutN/CcmL family microcompartment protein [Planctomycetia bacterium]|nr:EutN/CcmL family microcompartment protein [Planctomycetia bacterium]MCC7313658.1 EutN/CcmL family microcompartment protein [Planctomycetota bacterium]